MSEENKTELDLTKEMLNDANLELSGALEVLKDAYLSFGGCDLRQGVRDIMGPGSFREWLNEEGIE